MLEFWQYNLLCRLAATQFWQHVMQTKTAVALTAPRKPNEIFKPYLMTPEDDLQRLQNEIQRKNQGTLIRGLCDVFAESL